MRKPFLKALFHFSRKERAGILLLLLLILFTSRLPHWWAHFHRTAVADTIGFYSALRALEALQADSAEVAAPYGHTSQPTLFYFDPNTLSAAGWQQLGVSACTAATIARYLEKGGRFRQAMDLQRIYGLPPVLCRQLQPYVRIVPEERPVKAPDSTLHFERRYNGYTYRKDSSAYHPKPSPRIIDINTADTTTWQSLPGIGPGFARRIVAFRDKLGGFYDIVQVGECYGLPDSTFKKIQPFLQNGNSSLKKLDLNLTDEKSLAAHPYIRYKLARLIVQYRSAHGGFRHVEELRQLPLVDEIIYRKIEHYIVITF
ncbi:helix-hairpin-helix domain-containing protein [Chitinophaga sp. HK235]|uniref:ComEA family DNA-binding protein n=1 Tax=Chitinophaga sp. HK235 TaxID=2952571 RepID=UPI001BA905C9|nr:helix-hairpin-helix domain-containing protein [Chitinophaga sp. HK235]